MTKRKCTERPQKSGERSNRLLIRLATLNRLGSSSSLVRLGNEAVSQWTVRRRLNRAGLRQYRCPFKPFLSPANKEARYRWALNHNMWPEEGFGRVVWSDESGFLLFVNDGRLRIWRHRRENLDVTQQLLQQGGASVHVWAAIWHDGRSSLQVLGRNVTGQSYCGILTNFLEGDRLPIGEWRLQHDNAPAHRSQLVQQFLENHQIPVVNWPSRSPDLNPIEHAWDYVGRRVHSRNPTSLRQMADLLIQEWELIPQNYFNNLIGSMRNRIRAVIESNGGPTRY